VSRRGAGASAVDRNPVNDGPPGCKAARGAFKGSGRWKELEGRPRPHDGAGRPEVDMSDVQTRAAAAGRRLNHVEFVHRPGEGELVIELFAALGCPSYVVDSPPFGKYVVVQLDGSPPGENDIFVSQAEPEQLALEDALRAEIESGASVLAGASARFRSLQRERPFRAAHVGLRAPSAEALDGAIARLRELSKDRLRGRLDLGEPLSRTAEEADSMSAPVKQIWIWTDVVSTGLLAVGQQFELQAYS
jgi:hypothetical protein